VVYLGFDACQEEPAPTGGTFTFLSEASNGLPILNLGKAKFEELQVPALV